jgi:hypothetical protein
MNVRWTTDAADDLERICDYIAGLATWSPSSRATRLDSGTIFSLPGVVRPTPNIGL